MASQEADYSQLPMEIIVNILSHLGMWDLKSTMQTCHRWLCASQFPKIQEKTTLILTEKFITQQSLFTNSFRTFRHIYLHTINSLDTFFSLPHICNGTESITFDHCNDLTVDKFVSIIENMKYLKNLKFSNTSFNDIKIEDQEKFEKFQNRIPQLKGITFLCEGQFKIIKLCWLIKLFQNMKNLEIFEIVDDSVVDSLFEKKFEFFLYQIIKRNAKTLKVLRLPHFFKKDNFLKSLLLMNGLQLNVFNIQYLETKWINLDKFVAFQNKISTIQLSNCNEIIDSDIEIIVENLKLLEFIELDSCTLLTNKSLIKISEIRKLIGLKITDNENFTSTGILNGIAKEKNFYFKKLFSLGVSFNEKTYIKIAENLPNVNILHIGCRSINNNAIQAIIKNCIELLDLNLYGSSQITDYGLTGIDQFGAVPIQIGYSIQNLNKLKILNLRRCSKLTDCTLVNGFKLPNLKVLYLPSCFPFVIGLPWLKIRKISLPGFQEFVNNCPNIEILNLMGCSGFENLDIGISIVLKELKYLKTVEIGRRCEIQLEDQHAILKKGRRDLSKINIFCRCTTCVNIRKYCEEFVDKKTFEISPTNNLK